MAKNDLRIRVKSEKGNHALKNITSANTVLDLKRAISDVVSIPVGNLKILFGFPPKRLEVTDEALLETTALQSNETLIVEFEAKPLGEVEKTQATCAIQEEPSVKIESCISSTPGAPMDDAVAEISNHVGGIIMRKEVPSDNSCLFTSVGFVMSGNVDVTVGSLMREIISNTIASNKDMYSEAFLGKPTDDYCAWILDSNSWGGAIELSILSQHFGFEIAVVNTSTGVISKFGEDKDYGQRVFLIFDGIHYDPLYMDFLSENGDKIQTMFPTSNEEILREVEQLAKEAQKSKQYTDVHRFLLSCGVCGATLVGQLDAQNHAKQTGHQDFTETQS